MIPPFVGGGFGGKTANQQAIEAARLAKKTGRPVQVAWTRAEEFFFDTFRPAAVVKIDAGVGEGGRIAYWDYTTYFAGSRGADHFYDIPNHRTVAAPGGLAWRSGHPSLRNRRLAGAGQQHQHLCPRVAYRHPGRAGRGGPGGVQARNLKDTKMRRVLKPPPRIRMEGRQWRRAGEARVSRSASTPAPIVGLAAEVEVDASSGRSG